MHAYASAWHRLGEELGASGTGEPSTHASKPFVWDRLGEGSEASGAAEAAAAGLCRMCGIGLFLIFLFETGIGVLLHPASCPSVG